jgi:protoheme IX farnesyltransferase
MSTAIANITSVFKIRIGFAIVLCALAGYAIMPGEPLAIWQIIVLAVTVLLSSASAGALNQFMERDIDAQMTRTANRPFASGEYQANGYWLSTIIGILVFSIVLAAWALNIAAAIHILLGAVFYGVVYTIWLKRRTWWNVVVGGLAGSFAVLAGAAAIDPNLAPGPVLLAVVLFLWTPPHFWSLATALRKDYAKAGIPMLPVVVGDHVTAWAIFAHVAALVLLSLGLVIYGLGPVYLIPTALGGLWFIKTSIDLINEPGPKKAMKNFHASLIQLSVLLLAAIVDGGLIMT